jgi:hypothetical protein
MAYILIAARSWKNSKNSAIMHIKAYASNRRSFLSHDTHTGNSTFLKESAQYVLNTWEIILLPIIAIPNSVVPLYLTVAMQYAEHAEILMTIVLFVTNNQRPI